MLIASVRTCCSWMRQPSSSTVCTISASRSCGPPRPGSRRAAISASIAAANSGNAPSMPFAALGLAERRPRAVQQLVAPRHHLVVQLVGDAELVRGDRTGQRDRQLAPSGRRRRRRARPRGGGARSRGSTSSAAFAAAGVKPRSSRRRMRGCSGASISPRKLSSSGTVTPGARMSPTDDSFLASRKPYCVSANDVVNTMCSFGPADRALLAQLRQERPVLGLGLVHRVEREVWRSRCFGHRGSSGQRYGSGRAGTATASRIGRASSSGTVGMTTSTASTPTACHGSTWAGSAITPSTMICSVAGSRPASLAACRRRIDVVGRVAPERHREPAVGPLDDRLERLRPGRGAEQHRRMRSSPPASATSTPASKLEVLAVERRLVLGPQRLHRQHLLAHERSPLLPHDAVILCLVDVPAVADAELDATAGQVVEGGDLLRRVDRVALGGEVDARAEPDASTCTAAAAARATIGSMERLYSSGSSPATGNGVARLTGMWVWSPPTCSDAQPASLALTSQIGDRRRLVGRDDDDADVHAQPAEIGAERRRRGSAPAGCTRPSTRRAPSRRAGRRSACRPTRTSRRATALPRQ